MDETVENLHVSIFAEYNEELEAECVLRARSILDEYICPETGVALLTSQRHLLMGVRKLWSLSMEMKRLDDDIRQRLVVLPLLFIVILLHAIEVDYLVEEQGKQEADVQSAEVLLQIFYDVHDKLPVFKSRKPQRIASRTIFTYLRHLIIQFGAGEHVKPFAYLPNKVESGRIKAPFRPGDMKNVMTSMRHFRDKVLPAYNRGKVCYKMSFKTEVLDIMEPTREEQLEWAGILNSVSAALVAFGMVVFSVIILSKMASALVNSSSEDPEKRPQKFRSSKAKDPHPIDFDLKNDTEPSEESSLAAVPRKPGTDKNVNGDDQDVMNALKPCLKREKPSEKTYVQEEKRKKKPKDSGAESQPETEVEKERNEKVTDAVKEEPKKESKKDLIDWFKSLVKK